VERLGVAVPAVKEAEMLRRPREAAVDVQIGLVEFDGLPLNHNMLY